MIQRPFTPTLYALIAALMLAMTSLPLPLKTQAATHPPSSYPLNECAKEEGHHEI